MTSRVKSGYRLAAVSTLAILVAACTATPQPFSQAEFEAKAQADLGTMFADQAALTGPLTLDQALSRVLTYNLDRRVKMMEQAVALGQLNLDRFDLLPKLTANAGYDWRSNHEATVSRDTYTEAPGTSAPTYSADRDMITADLGMTWNILDFGVSYFTAQQNADRALIAEERRRKTIQNLAQEVRFAFWRAAAAQELKAKITQTVSSAEEALGDAERVETEGLKNPIESLRIQKTLLESIRQLETIQNELTSAKAQLAALVNLPPGSDFTLATDGGMDLPSVDLPVERMEELALANNPDLREQDYQSRIAIDETRKAILKLLPGISFSLSRKYDSNSFLDENRWNAAGAMITWNLLNILSAPDRIKHANTSEQLADARRLALRMSVLAQVHVVANQLNSATREFRRADKLWRIEERLADTSSNQQRGGTQNLVEKITVQTSAIAAELRRYQAYAEVQSAFGKLQATIGKDPAPVAVTTGPIEAPAAPVETSQPLPEPAAETAQQAATEEPTEERIRAAFSRLLTALMEDQPADEKPVLATIGEAAPQAASSPSEEQASVVAVSPVGGSPR